MVLQKVQHFDYTIIKILICFNVRDYKELLRDGGLSHAEQAEVDAELAGATYVE